MAFDQPTRIIDLHVHSTASDGTLRPTEIIAAARRLNLGAISITDHDTLAGAREALSAGVPPSVKFLTGVEISTHPPASYSLAGSMHLLGYGIRLDEPALNGELARLQAARANRNPEIVRRLNALGLAISYDALVASCEGQLSRPHIARYLREKGYVASIDDAFDTYLGKGRPAYVDKYRIDWRRAIQLVRDAGGRAVLAHPGLLNLPDENTLERLIVTMTSAGLSGIEVYYPDHTSQQTIRYEALARSHGLIMTGGTDYHGAMTPHIELGIGRGDLHVPYDLYEEIVRNP